MIENAEKHKQVTKLNAVQQQLLQLFSKEMDDDELADIQKLPTAYYDERLQDSFDNWKRQ